MMDWKPIVEQLKNILQIPLMCKVMNLDDWRGLFKQRHEDIESGRAVARDRFVYFLLGEADDAEYVNVLMVEEALITQSEKQLIEMLLEAGRYAGSSGAGTAPCDDERKALQIKDWLLKNLESGETRAEMPALLSSQLGLYVPRIPFLLYGDYSDSWVVSYTELKRLLESFFDADIVLIPLMDKEWLILGSESLLEASRDDDDGDGEAEETTEEALSSLCSGLYDMLSNEWVGECHVTINYPMTPATSLLASVHEMREAIRLGKMYNLGSSLHFPWSMHMEKLLYAVPNYDRMLFVDHVLRGIDHVLDSEMLMTLEHFFSLDCNVSETAKKLYIHRNTLLYRLDKFKQETGKDVRSFSDAVLVKTALLLYKVTKRK